jgi:hypothetical protein
LQGKFVLLYKTLMLAQKRLLHGGKEAKSDAFFAGLVGGYIVFGKDTNVNQQIVLYLLSRIIVGMAKWSVKKNYVPSPGEGKSFPVMAAVVWGIVVRRSSVCCASHCQSENQFCADVALSTRSRHAAGQFAGIDAVSVQRQREVE